MDDKELIARAWSLVMLYEEAIAGVDKFSVAPSQQDIDVLNNLIDKANKLNQIEATFTKKDITVTEFMREVITIVGGIEKPVTRKRA